MNGNTGYGETEKNTAAESMKPGFQGGAGGGEIQHGLNVDNPGSGKDERGAQNDLAEAEKAAENAGIGDGIKNSVTGARENEEKAGGLYKGSGRKTLSKVRPTGFRGIVKKGGPLYAILFSVFVVGGLMAGTQFFQPFSLVAQIQETFGSMEVSANRRSERFFRAQMETKRTKSPYNVFGSKFSISKKQATELKKQGVEYIKDYEGSGVKVLKYEDADGVTRIVAANDTDVETLKGKGIEASAFKKVYSSDPNFFSSYNKGSKTWRGAIANMYGTGVKNFLSRNKLTRNLFANYLDKLKQADAETSRLDVALKMMEEGTEEIGGGRVKRTEVDSKYSETEADGDEMSYTAGEDADGDGEVDKKKSSELTVWQKLLKLFGREDFSPREEESSEEKIKRSELKSREEIKAKLEGIAAKYSNSSVAKGGGTASMIANYTCLSVNVMGGITLMVQAAQALQIMHLTTGYFEVFDKAKAGYGDDAPINELMNTLNEKKRDEYVTLTSSETPVSSTQGENVAIDGIKTLKADDSYVVEKSAMESAGIAALYSGGLVNPNDPGVKNFNFSSNVKSIFRGIGTSMDLFKGCSVARIGAAVAGLVGDAISGLKLAGCIAGVVGAAFTLGASATACAPLIAGGIVRVGLSIGTSMLIAGIISTVTPVVTNMLTNDLISNIGGDRLGNALAYGALVYMGGMHRSNGGSLAKRKKYIQFAAAQQSVIAENAKQERENLSPFDLTSKYTFMGSIMTQLMRFSSTSTVMNTVTSGGSLVSSSLLAMAPTASAYDIAESLPTEEEYEETCPYLASIGAVGDSYCNPYVITDVGTMELDPQYDVIDKLAEMGNFEEYTDSDEESEDEDSAGYAKNVVIKKDSPLMKYAIFCDQRESGFGIADQNIANAVTNTGSLSNAVNSAIGSIPAVGDIVDISDTAEQLDNIGYISGESCVAGNDIKRRPQGSDTDYSPDWEEAKLYQRFIEDQALAESMGLIEKSAVTVALEDYYKENPLDNSYEGILARYTGMEKEDVVALLDIMDYYNYIAQYDPSTRYAFGESEIEVEDEPDVIFEHEYVLDGEVVLLGEIIYADVRNRSYAV